MGYTTAQKQRAIKKLARLYGKYNGATRLHEKEVQRRIFKMHMAAFLVIRKFGFYSEYQKACREAFKELP